MFRQTKAIINLHNIYKNTKDIVDKFAKYKYKIGVIKADAYSHGANEVLNPIINARVNYIAVSTLEEALEIRKLNSSIPILCFGIIPIKYLKIAYDNNIAITVSNLEYAKSINIANLKVHIKINSGMNRLGFKDNLELINCIDYLEEKSVIIEGIYTHIHSPKSKIDTMSQIKKFEEIIKGIDINNFKIVHIYASYCFEHYEKLEYANGIRIGINMYGISEVAKRPTFKLESEIVQINKLEKGESLGYSGIFTAQKEELIGVVPIGYADGITRDNTGRVVYINDKKYTIVGNICMDMLFVKIDNSIKVGDKVSIIHDNQHLEYIALYTHSVPSQVLCQIGKRVPRVYIR